MGHVMFPVFILVVVLFRRHCFSAIFFFFYLERTVAIVGGVLRLANFDSHSPLQCPLFFCIR